jgi:hypothetical protein
MLAELIPKIAMMQYEEEERKPYYPRPSIAGPQRCIRQMVYWAREEEQNPLPGRAVLVFDDSSWHEELTADWVRKSIFQIHSEQMPITIPDVFPWMPTGEYYCNVCDKLTPYRACHGHIDWLITDIINIDRWVEHKALSHFGFEGLMKGELPLDYLTQMAIYARGLQQDNPELKEGLLLVKNKNQSGYLEFRCRYNAPTDTLTIVERLHHAKDREELNKELPNITNDAFAKFAEVEKYRLSKKLPDRPYEIDSWRCDYCPYNKTCWAGWVDEHKQLTTDVALEDEIVTALKLERELALHQSDITKQREEVREEIKGFLKSKKVRAGKAGPYSVDWTVKIKKKVNQELIPAHILREATKDVPQERLSIRKKKEKDG